MKLGDTLTIVIPLKGRLEYTRRILEYASWVKCPFKILLGDGGDDDLVLDAKDFDVEFECVRYPYDKDIQTYNKKMNDLLSRVTTPLTMLIDNDNFFCLEGVYRVIKFLHENKDFTGGRGCLTRCVVEGKKLGPERRKMHYHPPILGSTAAERVAKTINLFHTHLHDVVKTDVLQTTFDIMDVVSSSDFKVFIRLNAFYPVACGNNYRNDDFTYFFHEDGTPRVSGQVLPAENVWIQQSYWKRSIAELTSAIGASIAHIDGINIQEAKRAFLTAFIKGLLDREDPGHRIPTADTKTREYLANSIDSHIEESNRLNIDEKVKECFLKDRTNSQFKIDELDITEMNDDAFRDVLNEYLTQRKFCL